jgi:hypothetical protein
MSQQQRLANFEATASRVLEDSFEAPVYLGG